MRVFFSFSFLLIQEPEVKKKKSHSSHFDLLLTFDLYDRLDLGGVWGPRRLLRGFQFHPPFREDGRMDRRRTALLSDTR